jgi:hypothetical protein
MSRLMVFWDTRRLLARFAYRKSAGQATSRRSKGAASPSTFRSVIVFSPRLREKPNKRGAARISSGFSSRMNAARKSSAEIDALGTMKVRGCNADPR